MTWPERELDAAQQATLQGWLVRRLNGEPIAHLVGEREFWSLPLKVSPATLIPRPDTEVLVEQALTRIPQGPCAVLDLGTGTGAIALALKSERPEIDVWAVDRMADAAALARENSVALGLPIEVRDGSWFEPLGEPDRDETPRFAVIVSNPPILMAPIPISSRVTCALNPARRWLPMTPGWLISATSWPMPPLICWPMAGCCWSMAGIGGGGASVAA